MLYLLGKKTGKLITVFNGKQYLFERYSLNHNNTLLYKMLADFDDALSKTWDLRLENYETELLVLRLKDAKREIELLIEGEWSKEGKIK